MKVVIYGVTASVLVPIGTGLRIGFSPSLTPSVYDVEMEAMEQEAFERSVVLLNKPIDD